MIETPEPDYDDPALYPFDGMMPPCGFIVHWAQCRLDAGHNGRHSPGRLPAEAASPAALDVERRLRAARFVAEHWRDAYMQYVRQGKNQYGIGTHPLALVLAALDGEDNPVQLGLSDDVHDAFAARLTEQEDEAIRMAALLTEQEEPR